MLVVDTKDPTSVARDSANPCFRNIVATKDVLVGRCGQLLTFIGSLHDVVAVAASAPNNCGGLFGLRMLHALLLHWEWIAWVGYARYLSI
jgi:hypothetical protein